MDIRNLTTFIHVAEMNSFTKAANFLGYSQSTVSFQIKQLEEELSCQLFERINHSISLTQEGRRLLEYAHRINKLTEEMKESVSNSENVSGNVRLATADSLCSVLLSKKLVSFNEMFPAVTLKISTAGTDEMFRMLDNNEADAILTLDSHIYSTDYIVEREEKISVCFVASSNMLNRIIPGRVNENNLTKLSIRDIIDCPFILTEKGMSYRRIFDEKLAEMSLEIHPLLEAGNTDLIAELAEQGAGIALLPDFVVKDRIKEGKLIRLDIFDIEIEIWKQLIYHRKKWMAKHISHALEHFCDF